MLVVLVSKVSGCWVTSVSVCITNFLQEQFLGEQGLRHSNGTVRSRLSYLFVRFIKAVK